MSFLLKWYWNVFKECKNKIIDAVNQNKFADAWKIGSDLYACIAQMRSIHEKIS